MQPNSKAAYRCYKGRLENKFGYLALNFAASTVSQSHRVTSVLSGDPTCSFTVSSHPVIQKNSSSEVRLLENKDT